MKSHTPSGFDHSGGLDWAYLPGRQRARLVKGEGTRLEYLKLGETFIRRGLSYNDLLLYMRHHSDKMTQSHRDAMDLGYSKAAGRLAVFPEPKLLKPKPPKKKKGPKKKRKTRFDKKKRPPQIPETLLQRYFMPVARDNRNHRANLLRRGTKGEYLVKIPTRDEIRARVREVLPISWWEFRRRYPAVMTKAVRLMVHFLIDREIMLYELAKVCDPRSPRTAFDNVVKLVKTRVAPSRPKRRAAIAKKKLAEKQLAKKELAESKERAETSSIAPASDLCAPDAEPAPPVRSPSDSPHQG